MNRGELRVHLLAERVAPDQLRDRTVVVVDVLRASTTIVHAMAARAARSVLCEEVAED